ncbi:MAG TPA: 2-C-methyl-D-erythritol 4-phosphate cytidylyltransferase [Steroidobacteraceae bacterium]|nr:2-C-methyl-D-erythritol 4-phosphate cytidylyltransferase [Steroidobacteraceae bacterium]
MRYWLVMPAAGAGQRFGADLPKQYAPLEGRTVIEWALAPFIADPRCARTVVAVAAADKHWAAVGARLGRRAAGGAPPQVGAVTGGAHRSLSVRAALAALDGAAAAEDWVLVHDAARPCLASSDLERLLEALARHPIGGLLAAPAADTLKRARPGAVAEVDATLERVGLRRALTPQMFRYGRLCAALDAAHADGRFPSDEAQALEWQGAHPVLVAASAANIKITGTADLALAAAILRAQRAAS